MCVWTQLKRRWRFADTVSQTTVRVHSLLSEVHLRHVEVVGSTRESNIGHASIAAEAVRVVVMVLEPVALGTSSAVVSYIGALSAITFPNDTPHRGRDAALTQRRVGIFDILSRTIRFTETLGFEDARAFRSQPRR